jgi:hypothetical protein
METLEKSNKRNIFLEEERHKETIDAIKGLSNAIVNSNKNETISKAIENNTKEIGSFGKALGELKVNVQPPNVNVQTNNEKVVSELTALKEQGARIEQLLIQQNKYFEEMCKPKDYDFEFTRNNWGVMQSPIKARAKTISKPKAQA